MNIQIFLTMLMRVTVLIGLLAGCAAGPEPTVTPTAAPTYEAVPTYTPTPQTAAAALSTATAEATVAPAVPATAGAEPTVARLVATAVLTDTGGEVERLSTPAPTTPVVDAAPPSAPTPAGAQLTVSADAINIRSGPDTTFEIVGSATTGEQFDLLARSPDGAWWQVCCINGQEGWVYGELATVANAGAVAVADEMPTPAQPTPAPVAAVPTAVPSTEPVAAPVDEPVAEAPAPLPPVDPAASSAGDFNPEAQYQIVHFRVLGLGENNGGIRDSGAQHHIFLTVLDQSGNGVNGAVVENLVGEKGRVTTGDKGPGKAEITMYWEPFKLRVASDPSGAVTSQTSNQMGLAFPHLPDLVGKLGDENYEYGACPTIDIKCAWPIQAIHFSYEITFQKVR